MDRIEPYIGMPIILGDGGMQFSAGTDAKEQTAMQEARIVSGRTCRNCPPPAKPEKPDMPERPQEPEKPDMPEKPQEPEEPDMPEKPQEPQTPQNPERPQEPENGPNGCQPCLKDRNCDCSPQVPQQVMMPAMAYVPWQKWQQPYDYAKGFETGTIFPDLDLPFSGYRGGRRR